MAGLIIDDGIKESDYGYVLRVSGPREYGMCAWNTALLRVGSQQERSSP